MVTQPPVEPRTLAHVLMEETDPGLRLDAHLALGQRALDRKDALTARTHFSEALEIDPTDERPKASLRGLEVKKSNFFRFWRR